MTDMKGDAAGRGPADAAPPSWGRGELRGGAGEVSTCRNVREISGAPSQRPRPGAESTKRCRDVKVTELRRSEAKRFLSASRSDGETRGAATQPTAAPPLHSAASRTTRRFTTLVYDALPDYVTDWFNLLRSSEKMQIVPQG